MSDTDSDIEVLTFAKPSTSQVPAIRVNNSKGKQREIAQVLSSETEDDLPALSQPKKSVKSAAPLKKTMSSKTAAMLAKIGEATRSDPESEDDSGIKLLDRSASSSSAEKPKAKPTKRSRDVSDEEDELASVGVGRKSKTASVEETAVVKAKPAAKKVCPALFNFDCGSFLVRLVPAQQLRRKKRKRKRKKRQSVSSKLPRYAFSPVC